MGLFLTKFIALLVQPLGLVLLTLLVALFLLRRTAARAGFALVALSVFLLWVFATPYVANELIATLEKNYPPKPVSELPNVDAIVILGGGLSEAGLARGEADMGDAADRVLFGARLYWASKAPVVILSGGTLPWKHIEYSEAQAMQSLLQEWGVPEQVIILEEKSRTTRENAVQVAQLLKDEKLEDVLLVTSASHMSRALATFTALGVKAQAASTDQRSINQPALSLFYFLPDARELERSSAAIWEMIGNIYYRWRGWI